MHAYGVFIISINQREPSSYLSSAAIPPGKSSFCGKRDLFIIEQVEYIENYVKLS